MVAVIFHNMFLIFDNLDGFILNCSNTSHNFFVCLFLNILVMLLIYISVIAHNIYFCIFDYFYDFVILNRSNISHLYICHNCCSDISQ